MILNFSPCKTFRAPQLHSWERAKFNCSNACPLNNRICSKSGCTTADLLDARAINELASVEAAR